MKKTQKISAISNHIKNQKSPALTFSQFKDSFFFKPVIQPKLTINQPNDIYEQEADAMAAKVMRMTSNKNENTFFKPANISSIQRKCAHCEGEEKKLQRKENASVENSVAPASVHDVLNSSTGKNLDTNTRNFFEPRFGYDFSNVRIHNDSLAAKSAQSINALAYTTGDNIVFNQNQFAPETDSGKKLLAHELTHVVQQKSSGIVQMQQAQSASQPAPQIVAPRTPNSREAKIIETARLAAFARSQTAYQLLAGIRPPGRDQSEDQLIDATNRHFAQSKIETLLEPNLDYDQVTDIVGDIRARLTPGVNIMIAQQRDPECGNRAGYVRGFRPPIVLCPAFFSSSPEERIRTLIHESAHLSHIGSAAVNESYCAFFDCSSNCGGFQSADGWAHLIHCLSGQTPDQPTAITGRAATPVRVKGSSK